MYLAFALAGLVALVGVYVFTFALMKVASDSDDQMGEE